MRMSDIDPEDPRLINYVAAAIRKADGSRTMGASRLAEVAVSAVFEFLDMVAVR
jgi:hypothetical protein